MEGGILSRGKFFLGITFLILATQPAALLATPTLQENRSQAKKIADEISSIDDRLEVAVEQYNQAQVKLGRLQQELAATRARLAKAQAELNANQNTLNRRVAGIYKAGQTVGVLEVVLSSKNLGEFISAIESLERVSKHDAALLTKIKAYRVEVENAGRALAEEENSQASTVKSLNSRKTEVQGQMNDRQATLKKVKDQIAQAESAQAAARLTRAISVRPSLPPPPAINVPASGKGAAAVRIALAQLGKPYVWAAAGPNSFDCSGLTMYVYAQVGISLPHSAAAQFNMGRRVSRDQLQPGDLIFGAQGGYVSHVGIYIGGDSYVTAPQTGDVVKISRLSQRRNYVGAVRLF